MLQSYPQLRLSPFISSSRPLLDRISTEICIIRARNERTSGAKEIQQSYRRHSAFRHTLYHSFSFITMKTKKMLTAKQKEESRIRLTLLLTWIRIRIDSPESKELNPLNGKLLRAWNSTIVLCNERILFISFNFSVTMRFPVDFMRSPLWMFPRGTWLWSKPKTVIFCSWFGT